jgi:uncharacterized protein
MNSSFNECLAEGIALFNAGQWFEAHEVWEEAWRHEAGDRRGLLQGLILVAAGWLKREAGRAEGARTLFTRALERLEPLPDTCEGVDVGVLVPQVRHWREGGASPPPQVTFHPTAEEEAMQPFAEGAVQSCPYCGEEVDVHVDAMGPSSETYVEDCPVCCRPWTVSVTREEQEVFISLARDDD